MSIIERYILKRFIVFLTLFHIGTTTLFLLAEFIERIDDLVEKNASFNHSFLYFLYKVPMLSVEAMPVSVLLGSVTTLFIFSRKKEILSMLVSGISIYKIISPILIATLAIGLLNFLASEFITPKTNELWYYNWRVNIKKIPIKSYQEQNSVWFRSKDKSIIWFINHYDPKIKKMKNVTLFYLDKDYNLRKKIQAFRAKWDKKSSNWILFNGKKQKFLSSGNIYKKEFDKLVISVFEKPKDFQDIRKDPQQMNYREIRSYIEFLKQTGVNPTKFEVEKWSKIAKPFMIFILVLVIIPFSLNNSFKFSSTIGTIVSVVLGFSFFVIFFASLSLGNNETLPPFFCAFAPNVLFLGLGTYFLTFLKS